MEDWRENRRELIAALREVAVELDTMQAHYQRSKVAGGVTTVAGGIVAGSLFVASFFTAGLTLPAAIAAGVLSGGGAAVSIGAEVGKYIHQSQLLKKVQDLYNKDLKSSEKLKKILKAIPGIGKGGFKIAEFIFDDVGGTTARITSGASKAANVTKLAKVSGILGLVLLPLDIAFLIHDSVQVHKGSLHPAAVKIREIADKKEDELYASYV